MEPWEMSDDGMVAVPLDRPGIGVDVNMDFVDAVTVRQEKFTA
jgi:L-alanine-DL-glutamate epimerase-like enolase superfamily enzyme